MGTIITALDLGRPLIVMPRRAALREATNDHQLATAAHWAKDGRIAVAFDETELPAILDRVGELKVPDNTPTPEAERLLAAIRAFIAAR
jgi:UDP-N-acetylglucosamine transferase subunit ALG13